eukprot:Em0014g401a
MQYSGSNRDVPAIIEHEQEACEAYANIMAVKHATFKVNLQLDFECALGNYFWLQPQMVSFLQCSCCGEGLLEIKCPFKYRNSQTASIEDESFYLHKVGSEVTLDKKHDYYYQVQGQMAIWKKPYCDFICWTTKGLIITRIQTDGNFLEELRLHARYL